MSERILLPVVGLNITRPWDVGRVRFHPAGAAPGLIEAARAGSEHAAALQPDEQARLREASARLSTCVVAEVSVSHTGSVAVAETLVESALAALNLVQHMENKPLLEITTLLTAFNLPRQMENMPWLVAFQRFGLPGRASTASYDWINLSGGKVKPAGVPELGFRAVGAIMGVTTFGDDLHRAWTSDPATASSMRPSSAMRLIGRPCRLAPCLPSNC